MKVMRYEKAIFGEATFITWHMELSHWRQMPAADRDLVCAMAKNFRVTQNLKIAFEAPTRLWKMLDLLMVTDDMREAQGSPKPVP